MRSVGGPRAIQYIKFDICKVFRFPSAASTSFIASMRVSRAFGAKFMNH